MQQPVVQMMTARSRMQAPTRRNDSAVGRCANHNPTANAAEGTSGCLKQTTSMGQRLMPMPHLKHKDEVHQRTELTMVNKPVVLCLVTHW